GRRGQCGQSAARGWRREAARRAAAASAPSAAGGADRPTARAAGLSASSSSRRGFRAWRGGLRLGADAVVSFQRFQLPTTGRVREAPISLGAIEPAGTAAKGFLLPLYDGEAFWIGLDMERGSPPLAFSFAAELSDGSSLDLLS